MEEQSRGFDEFSVEMGSFEMRKVKKFDRLWKITTGGSIDQWPLVHEDRVYFGSLNHVFHCVDAGTGQLVWKYMARDRIGISSPSASDGIVYIGSYDQNMYALNASSGELVWKFFTRGEILSSPVVWDGAVYFGSRDKLIYALDAKTGDLLWKFKTMGEILSDATVHEGKIIIGSYDRYLYCLDGKTGDLVWKLRTDQEVVNSSQFAIVEGCMYLSSFDNNLRLVDLKSGREVWKKRLAQYGMSCGTVAHEGLLLVPSRDGNMFGLDLAGNVKWKFTTTKPVGTPVVHNGRVYFTSEDMNFYCLDLHGRLAWKRKTQDMTWWKPAFWYNLVYFGSYDCHFYACDSATGDLVWKFRTQGQPSSGPGPYDAFELSVVTPKEVVREDRRKEYNAALAEEGDADAHFYKSRITYQTSTQYQSRGGKYQVDSDEESL
ncbi:MAG: PQQ-binding-like beta-propeller repeat protein [Candidatus Aenigmarchaeota archaeon]|nr:PQQ-binding-like beta-propeller repeat protein [Candidatus Aenigmarchaeota archaeon]